VSELIRLSDAIEPELTNERTAAAVGTKVILEMAVARASLTWGIQFRENYVGVARTQA
jgi:hypothetical protein